MGNPILDSTTIVRFITESGITIESATKPGASLDNNYRMLIPMDSGTTSTPYDKYAQTQHIPYRIEVLVNGQSYLPIEIRGVSMNLGMPGEVTQLDLTLGEDADGDGLPDAWERALMQQGGDLAGVRADEDSDGDGSSNLEEYLAGTYAFDSNDGLRLVFKEISDSNLVFEFLGVTGRTYRLLKSTDLKEWTEEPFQLNGQEGTFENIFVPSSQMLQISLPNMSTLDPQATYKLVVK